jgi:GR25 family glycosyltransferase involved in LPS biosynthesis
MNPERLVFGIIVGTVVLVIVLLIVIKSVGLRGLEHFQNYNHDTDAYIISMSDKVYKIAEYRLNGALSGSIKKFDAVKGSELGSLVHDKDTLTLGALYDISIPDYRRTHAELGTKNAIGCYLSHVSLWKQLLASDKKGYFIFESDAICYENLLKYTDNFLTNYENGHILFFGNFDKDKSSEIKKVTKRFYGMHAYFITRKGAELCLKYAFPIEQQIDSYLSDLLLLSMNPAFKDSEIPEVNFYIVNVCVQYNPAGTTIQKKGVLCSG